MTILVVGSGGREHAISCAYERSSKVSRVVVAPGNDFIAYRRKKEVVCDKKCSLKSPNSILKIAKKYNPDLIDIAQDDALASGCVDLLKKEGFKVFGPTRDSSRIEWDKGWSREFMEKYNIPTPWFKYFDNVDRAKGFVEGVFCEGGEKMLYVKAAGLCEGKGALKITNLDEAFLAIDKMKDFGESGKSFLIEEGLVGEEFSYYAISDGKNYKIFKSAQDNKRVLNFDCGSQTGGMGVVSPAEVCDQIVEKIEEEQIGRAINGMFKEGFPYKGILYLGGIIKGDNIKNIEYNARWGDPECQTILPGVTTDYVDLVLAVLDGGLGSFEIEQDSKVRVCVVGSSRGYPEDYSNVKGSRIYGLEEAMKKNDVQIFGAGIKIRDDKFYVNGGRLFNVVAEGDNILEAKEKAYSAMAGISIEGNGLHYRTDIGWRDVDRELAREDISEEEDLDIKDDDWVLGQKDGEGELTNGERYWVNDEVEE
jgi:phosphoribosylamine---glycine ligase